MCGSGTYVFDRRVVDAVTGATVSPSTTVYNPAVDTSGALLWQHFVGSISQVMARDGSDGDGHASSVPHASDGVACVSYSVCVVRHDGQHRVVRLDVGDQ